MIELKLIPPDDRELDEMITRLEIKWSKKSVSVSVECGEPAVIDMAQITGDAKADARDLPVDDCCGCNAMMCAVDCQRLRRIQRAEQQVEADEDALARSQAHLREVVLHG